MASLVGCAGAAPKVDWTLGTSGALSRLLTLSYAELANIPQTDLNDILMGNSLGENTTPIRLVCPPTSANRWVFQLMGLQVNAQAAGVPDNAALKIAGFSIVAPSFPGNVQVKGVVEIQVE